MNKRTLQSLILGIAITSNNSRWAGRRFVLLTALVATLATIGGVALLINIFERRQEGRNPFYRVVELTDETEDPAVWGKTSRCNTTITSALWT